MILLFIRRAILIVVAASACFWLTELFGPWLALMAWAVVMAVACGIGATLLRSSELGQITWKNRVAGYLIPWGWRLNRGSLWLAAVISWLTWVAIGCMVAVLHPATVDLPEVGFRIALFVSWLIDASALMFILGTIRQATPGAKLKSLWKLVVLIALLIAVSVGLYLGGWPILALAVGGGPPLVAGVCGGAVVLVLMTVGRKARWN